MTSPLKPPGEFLCSQLLLAKIMEPDTIRRRMGLKRVDNELLKGNYKTALSLIKQMQGKAGGLLGFGAAKQVPRRISSLNDIELSGIDISSLESIRDSILESIQSRAEFRLSSEVSLVDLESLMHGRTYESLVQRHLMCMQHEAGHFLIGYLLGGTPKRYTVSNMESLRRDRLAVVGGCVQFLGFETLGEVHTAKKLHGNVFRGVLQDELLDKYMCVMLAGLVAEHLVFGYSQGFHSDLDKIEKVVKWMGFTNVEADTGVKWAITNTITILNRHQEARSRLAEAMGLGKSVGSCIDTIENTFNNEDI